MSEDPSFNLNPKNKIPAEVFIAAANGNYDNNFPGLYLFISSQLKDHLIRQQHPLTEEYEFESLFSTIKLYLFVDNVELILSEQISEIKFNSLGINKSAVNFIIYNSIIPKIEITESKTGNWNFWRSACGDISIQGNSLLENIRIFDNSTLGSISIHGNSFIGNISIQNSSISGNISIQRNSKSGIISLWNKSTLGSILLKSKSTAGSIRIELNSNCKNISISGNCTSGSILIKEQCIARNIWILENSTTGDILIEDNSTSGDIIGQVHSIIGNIRINYGSTSGNIWINDNCSFDNIEISRNSTFGNVWIENNIITGNILIQESNTSDNIWIKGNRSYCSLNVIFSTVNNINIESQVISKLFLASNLRSLNIDNCNLGSLQWMPGSNGRLYMNGGSLEYMQLNKTALSNETVLSFTNVSMCVIQLETLLVHGQLILRNISAFPKGKAATSMVDTEQLVEDLNKNFPNRPLFRIANSSLGKTEITGSDLTGFYFEYRDSKLLDCFLSGTQLLRDKVQIFEKGNDLKDEAEQKVSIYNQLRKLYESIGDIVEASEYQSLAMNSQQKLLQLNYGAKWGWPNKWVSDKGLDLLTFRLNKWSNKHGGSWGRALGYIVIVSSVFYIIYFIILFWNYPRFNGLFFKEYLTFLDITHKEDFITSDFPGVKVTFWPKLIDFMGRLFIGYGYYQFIAAFRKHGRKASL